MHVMHQKSTATSAPFLVVMLLFLSGCQKVAETEALPAMRYVTTQTVMQTTGENWLEFPAVVQAAQQAELGFRLSGKLSNILVEEGDRVEQNQTIATLENTDYLIQIKSAQAEYDRAKAEFERAESLKSNQLISQKEYDKLKAQYVAAQTSLEGAQQSLQYTIMKAPFKGIIARRHVDNYEDISPLQQILTIQDLSSLKIKVNIPETIMIRLKQDSSVKVEAIFDALPGQSFPLSLLSVSTDADPVLHTYAVSFNMPSIGNANILPGMSLTVRGAQQSLNNSILVPTHAVLGNADKRYIYVVQSNGNGTGLVQSRIVTIGNISEKGITILSGLEAGEIIVTAGMSKMSDGLQVRLALKEQL